MENRRDQTLEREKGRVQEEEEFDGKARQA